MARSVAEIQAQIIAQKDLQASLAGLSSPSQTAIWRLWTYIVAVAIAIFEQVLDVFKTDIEALVSSNPPQTEKYLKNKAINYFQYDAVTPQVLVSDETTNFVPTYPVVDVTKRIITRCSITTLASKIVEIKVAKSEPPSALAVAEKAAADSFFNEFLGPGVSYRLISDDADKIFVEGIVNFNGAYKTVIEANVKAALNTLYQDIASQEKFNGKLLVSDIEATIKGVPGVTDFKPTKVYGRADSTVFASATKIFDLSLGINLQSYEMSAGYGVEETTAGYTLTDSLTFLID